MDKEYDIAKICINGHVVNSSVTNKPDYNKKYCKKCGSETITNCPKCNAAIEGDCYTIIYDYDGPIKHKTESYILPSFCHNCGKAYPWTEKKIHTSQMLIAESENISPEEKEIIFRSIDDIIKDTPETIYSANKIKKILPKLGKEIAKGFRDIIVDVASETAKKILFP